MSCTCSAEPLGDGATFVRASCVYASAAQLIASTARSIAVLSTHRFILKFVWPLQGVSCRVGEGGGGKVSGAGEYEKWDLLQLMLAMPARPTLASLLNESLHDTCAVGPGPGPMSPYL